MLLWSVIHFEVCVPVFCVASCQVSHLFDYIMCLTCVLLTNSYNFHLKRLKRHTQNKFGI